MCIHVERVIKERANGSQTQVPIHPSNCEITKLKLDRNRKVYSENVLRLTTDLPIKFSNKRYF